MARVDGKVALVTGGGSGLGKADSELLAAEGAFVYVTDVNEEAAKAVAAGIGANAVGLKHDVSSEDDWKAVFKAIEDRHGVLDILVNNAGIVLVADVEQTELAQFERVMRIMSTGVFLGCKLAMPLLKKSRAASVINMSSMASHLGYSPFFAYSAAKGAVRSMTKSLAIHCQENGLPIRANSLHPGAIETPMIQSAEGRPGQENAIAEGVLPPSSAGSPKDVANLVLFLASDESRFLTGGEYLVDNGLAIRP